MMRLQRLRTLAPFAYLTLAVFLGAAALQKSLETVGMPFAGILPFANGYVGAFTQPEWEGGKLGLRYHDRIETEKKGDASVRVVVSRGGKSQESVLPVSKLSARDVFYIFGPLFVTGLFFFLIGAFTLFLSPAPAGTISFLLYCTAAGTYFLTAYDFHTTYRFVPLLLVSYALIPAGVIHLSVSFPKPLFTGGCKRLAIAAAYLISFGLMVPYVTLFRRDPAAWVMNEYALFFYLSAAYLWWTGTMVYRAFRDSDGAVRRQSRVILIPLLFSFGSVFVAAWLIFIFDVAVPLNRLVPLCLVFPGAILFAMLRRNLFWVDHLEHEIRKRTETLRKTQAELNEATKLAAVGLLAAGTAHEIGNAMNLVSSNLPVLSKYIERLFGLAENRGKKDEVDYAFMRSDLPDLLANLGRGAKRALDISADLKSFAKPQTGVREAIDLSEAINMTLRLLRPELGTRIGVKKNHERVPAVSAVRGQIHQVLLNLILNAIQAIEREGEIEISVKADGQNVVTSIRDNGIGIDPETAARAFEPFFTTKPNGAGLGLSVSYGIVQAHGGKLSIAGNPGRGTRITMSLPIRADLS